MKRWHLTVAEAAALLVLARLLISGLRFGHWRRWLGPLVQQSSGSPPSQADLRLANAVQRAALRLPGAYKCLPQAVALHWMLRWRGRPSDLVIAVLPGAQRGGLDDLHAWVEVGGTILIGALDLPFRPLGRFGGVRQG